MSARLRLVLDVDFVELVTPRLRLRRFRDDDLDAFVAYRSDPAVARFQGWDAPFPVEVGRQFIAEMLATHPGTPGEWFQFAVERQDRPGLIGDCAACFRDGFVEIGFTLAPAHQGAGYATEAVDALLGYLAGRGHTTVEAWADLDNEPSARVLERLGFAEVTVEGDERQYRRRLSPSPGAPASPDR